MYKFTIIMILTIFSMNMVGGQSIRKNYNEMTQSEKDELVAAFNQLGPPSGSGNLIEEIATFHDAHFDLSQSTTPIHNNLPGRPDLDVFLAWHRRQIFEVEQAMQDINPLISIPFWDWTVDRSENDPLWDNSFMGQFETSPVWGVVRNFNDNWNSPNPHLPTSTNVTNLQGETVWLTYSRELEGGSMHGLVHVGAHRWIGGTMQAENSPLDPVFYLHHGMIDKLWQDWVEDNGITPSSNLYQITALPRYPLVNPDNIVDSRALGVFFANDVDHLATLDDYTVSNTYNSQEVFYYQYTIEAGDDFIVPLGTDAKIESVNEVILKDGFHAELGSEFIAKIDTDDDINTAAKRANPITQDQIQGDNTLALNNIAYSIKSVSEEISVDLFPNPTRGDINIEINPHFSNGKLELIDIQGRRILSKDLESAKEKINIEHLESGFYLMKIYLNSKTFTTKKIVKE